MKPSRIIVLVIALAAGGVVAMLMGGRQPAQRPQPVVQAPQIQTVEVLVARSEIGMGHAVTEQDLQWVPFPQQIVTSLMITRASRPNAVDEFKGAISRTSILSGEPIRDAKLIRQGGSGFLSAILTPGMRAVATEIRAESASGGFILPNDRVDVILVRRDLEQQKATGFDVWTSETILTNVRVLAINAQVEDKDGQRNITGQHATLELSSRQAETLALSHALAQGNGQLALVLRPLAETVTTPVEGEDDRRRGTISVVRNGVSSTVTPR
jgi:pilus assembly protein CpaB